MWKISVYAIPDIITCYNIQKVRNRYNEKLSSTDCRVLSFITKKKRQAVEDKCLQKWSIAVRHTSTVDCITNNEKHWVYLQLSSKYCSYSNCSTIDNFKK